MLEYEVNVDFEKGEWSYKEWFTRKDGKVIESGGTIRNMASLPIFLRDYNAMGYVARAIRF